MTQTENELKTGSSLSETSSSLILNLRAMAVLSRMLVFISGAMIALPMICYEPLSIFMLGSVEQLMGVLATTGYIVTWYNSMKRSITLAPALDVLSFILLLIPLLFKYLSYHDQLGYPLFYVPALLFIVLQLVVIYLATSESEKYHTLKTSIKQKTQNDEFIHHKNP